MEKMSAMKEVPHRTKYSNLPRELKFDTTITRSDFSPPPSCVDAIQLANHIESTITFDDDSEITQESSNSLSGAEPQVEETVDDNTPLNLNIVSKDVHADESDAQVEPFQSEESTIDALPSSMSLHAAGVDVEKSDAPFQIDESTVDVLPSSLSLPEAVTDVRKNKVASPLGWSMSKELSIIEAETSSQASTIDDESSPASLPAAEADVEKSNAPFQIDESTIDVLPSSNSEESRLLEINGSEKLDEEVNENMEPSSYEIGEDDSMALDSDVVEKKIGEDNAEDDTKVSSPPKTTAKCSPSRFTDELVEKASKKSPETRSKTNSVKKATKTPKRLTPVVPSVRSTPESANTGEDFLSNYW